MRNKLTLFEKLEMYIGFGDEDACWPWLGSVRWNDRGRVSIDGVLHKAARVVYEVFIGPIPEFAEVCHKCEGNKNCINPDHFILGTAEENRMHHLTGDLDVFATFAGGR
jgi:HNH endonuclease